MLKANTLPQAGYANVSQGRMIGVVFQDNNYVLPTGFPGEKIMIPPPQFVIMEVYHKGKENKTSILPCVRQETTLEYYRIGKEYSYRCWSNMVGTDLCAYGARSTGSDVAKDHPSFWTVAGDERGQNYMVPALCCFK